jgi:arylsulfatase A-like enzyme
VKMTPILMAAMLLALPMTLWAADASPSQPPNILLIITDDQGYGDLSIHGNPHLRTPHLDGLARQGVQFERFYVNSFCAPTRAALLTGRYPLRTGCHGVTHNRESMRPSEVTIAEALRAAGYRSACIGKWHNGEQYPMTPQGQGFDESFGFNNGHWNQYFDAVLLRGARHELTEGYITDVLTDEAIRFIAANRTGPFFCYLSYNAPHSPYQVPDEYFERFKAKGFDDRLAAFYGMCENIDDNVGRLLAHLDFQRIADNTIVLFLTDNGGTAGVRQFNAGMRGGKTSVHEGGCRVPLFVRWPAAGWQPHVVRPIASHIDLYPTLLDLCGVPAPVGPPIDGISLRPLLESDDAADWPDRTLCTHNPIDETNKYPGAVRTQRYRLVRQIEGPAGGSSAKANDGSARPWQLYDMEDDPGQQRDIAAEHPGLVRQLGERYEAWWADISREGLQRLPLPVGHAEHNPVELHAPQAYFDPPLHFASGPGFANDWLTGWTDARAKVWFEIDVHTAGRYDVTIAYGCPTEDAGSQIAVSIGARTLVGHVPAAPAPELPLPHREASGRARYRNRDWATLKLGSIDLLEGPTRLTLEPRAMPGTQVMDLKHVELNLREDQASTSTAAGASALNSRQPNILFILADDLGWGDLGCYGNPHVQTPAIDALARRGVRLTAHYSPSPLCAPARAGYLTGRFNHRTGAVDVPSNRGLDRLDLSEKTFGDYFRHAGYTTALIGKWHNGLYCRDHLPHQRGFDLFFGFPNGGQDYWKWNLLRNDEHVPHDGRYLSDALNDEAIRFIRESKDAPFALFLAHHAPHSPLQAPEPLVRKVRERLGPSASEAVAITYAMIEAMDAGLGRVFQTLEDEGLGERTVIVFASDNGPVLGRDQQRFHGVWSGEKGDALEGGIRVPGIVAWPGRIPGGRALDTPVHGCDWLPTLFGLTGQQRLAGAKALDGLDLMPLLLGEPTPALTQRSLFFQRNRYAPVRYANAAIREGRWKLFWPGDAESLKKDAARDNPSYLRGIVRPHWEMPLDAQLAPPTTAPQPPPRLYDLETDPAERCDLAASRPEIVRSLAQKYDAWFSEILPQWQASRARIVEHDRAYWRDRPAMLGAEREIRVE